MIMRFVFVLILSFAAFTALCQRNPVIVELFTSQGCSSCPAADTNLKDIINEAESAGLPVYGLSFHVDYWNYIGWKDPYSNKEFTRRQRTYAQQLGLQTIYTPQMIVNGNEEFVGSNREEAKKVIGKSLAMPVAFNIEITAIRRTSSALQIEYLLNTEPISESLNVALVDRTVQNFVPRGENGGRTLEHTNVVVHFQTVPVRPRGVVVVPNASAKSGQMVVLFISDATGHVRGAIGRVL